MSTAPQLNPHEPSAEAPAHRPELDDAPPLLGSWRNIYILVMATFVVFVAVFWMLTEVYA
ncbi:hypothetical protein [Corallococcus macrosporus]|uniref:Uncharacterized protein n=2 Tax=Myxococcaceae TaxID=31 RepID=A0A250K2E9_9BACT|nr:hypothetical protein [Corallococcus macrosporus]AEI65000.1 hypothetical protein LILAB_15485 [Corallococcus macrosporus]ATB50279.1 hypothetical protein MYMAC_005934 [Corallococcus macrosporus DSM 14697]